MEERTRRRAGLLVLVAAAAALYGALAPRWPKDQVLHVVLGAAAPRVIELRLRYAALRGGNRSQIDEDWTREATFRFAEGNAPRVVTHEPRLADGEYVVEVELETPSQRTMIDRRITLQGGTTSIDVTDSVPPAPPEQTPVPRR